MGRWNAYIAVCRQVRNRDLPVSGIFVIFETIVPVSTECIK